MSKKTYSKEHENLERHFKDRSIASQSEFERQEESWPVGSTASYRAIDTAGDSFRLKTDYKKPQLETRGISDATLGWYQSVVDKRNDEYDIVCMVQEFVTAPFYRHTLHDRAPLVEGVEPQSSESEKFLIRSKYLSGFQTLAGATGNTNPKTKGMGPYKKALENVEGAEKLFASMLWDYDIHTRNVGIRTLEDGTKVYAKADQGWAGTYLFDNASDILKCLSNIFRPYNENSNPGGYGYSEIGLDVSKFKKAVNEQTQISDAEIDNIVNSRIALLKDMGVDINGLEFPFWLNDTIHNAAESQPRLRVFNDIPNGKTAYEQLADHYKSAFKRHRDVMKELGERLAIIERIDLDSQYPDWKKGQWLFNIEGNDPKSWAKKNGFKIAEKSPEEMALYRAAEKGHIKELEKLFDQGAKLGKDIIEISIERDYDPSYEAVLKFVIKHVSKDDIKEIDQELKDKALRSMAFYGNVDEVRKLLEANANGRGASESAYNAVGMAFKGLEDGIVECMNVLQLFSRKGGLTDDEKVRFEAVKIIKSSGIAGYERLSATSLSSESSPAEFFTPTNSRGQSPSNPGVV